MKRLAPYFLTVLCVVALAACGFHLSRPAALPFDTLYIVTPSYSSFGAELKRYLASTGNIRLVDRPEQAEVILEIGYEQQESQILALSVAGRVNELQLRYRLSFSLRDKKNRQWIIPTELTLTRDMTYDDTAVLARSEERRVGKEGRSR